MTESTESLTFEFDLKHPPEKVWRALTTPELLTQWLLPVIGFELSPGHTFTFEAEPQPGWDGVVNCRMIEATPHETLAWSWVVGDIDTVLRFTLAPSEAGTLLTIVQSGFKATQRQNLGGARYGWKMMSSKLIDLLEEMS